ncbi:protein Son-like isoform X2 [Prorops nasuta]|uniref:protein Son-like isoform X2 n=1 Tax=Prorops nasuta TaxID=863751 RepID=UPI0034CDA24E
MLTANIVMSKKYKEIQNKHPVSLLAEYCSKKKLSKPEYEVCFERGPAHNKQYVCQVTVNGVKYVPNTISYSKKEAKSRAALMSIKALRIIDAAKIKEKTRNNKGKRSITMYRTDLEDEPDDENVTSDEVTCTAYVRARP